jgi:hypothetical protein
LGLAIWWVKITSNGVSYWHKAAIIILDMIGAINVQPFPDFISYK